MNRGGNILLTVWRKEVLDGLRDRRSVLSALFFPVLMPFLITLLFKVIADREREAQDIDIPVVGADRAPDLIDFIKRRGYGVVPGPEDAETAVREKVHDFVLVIPEDFAGDFALAKTAAVELVHDGSRKEASAAVGRVRGVINNYSRMVGSLRLIARGISPVVHQAVEIDNVDVVSARRKAANLFTFIPMFVIIAAFISGMNIAIDTTAGERERSSLEPLLVNPVSRTTFVLGKWLATALFSGVGVLLTMASLTFALSRVPLHQLGIQLQIGTAEIAGMLVATLPLALSAAGLQVLLATFARSFKEAQTYASLLIVLPMVPHFVASLYSLGDEWWMLPIPALGQQVLMTDVLGSEPVAAGSFLTVGLSSAVIGLICVWITAKLFERERIVFGS